MFMISKPILCQLPNLAQIFLINKSVLRTLHKVERENNEKWNKLIVSFDTISFIILFLAEIVFITKYYQRGKEKCLACSPFKNIIMVRS